MVKFNKQQPISLAIQCYALNKTYSKLIDYCDVRCGNLLCVMRIKPSENSETYKVLIRYKISSHRGEYYPKVWLLEPAMKKREGKYPKHIYLSQADALGHQCLCLFYPRYKEWSRNMLISDTFVPWISAWLNTYEYWLITGKWHYAESPHGDYK
jgi:hypothetical protein